MFLYYQPSLASHVFADFRCSLLSMSDFIVFSNGFRSRQGQIIPSLVDSMSSFLTYHDHGLRESGPPEYCYLVPRLGREFLAVEAVANAALWTFQSAPWSGSSPIFNTTACARRITYVGLCLLDPINTRSRDMPETGYPPPKSIHENFIFSVNRISQPRTAEQLHLI